jgi:hypothetical protein
MPVDIRLSSCTYAILLILMLSANESVLLNGSPSEFLKD